MRRRISTGTSFIAFALVLLLSAQAAAAVSWSAAKTASASHGFNVGRALAASKSGSTTYVHQVYVNDYPGGTLAGDGAGAPHEQVWYQRRTAAGAVSGPAVHINKPNEHGNGSSVAAAGSHVYVVWTHLAKYAFGPTDARTLQFRSNAHNGSGAWSSIKSLTTSGQIDQPSVAASGAYVYIAYTNTATGEVKLQISRDYGSNFHVSSLSMTTVTYDNGFGRWGLPSVAAAGSNVGLAWLSGNTFTASAWTSTNHARSKTDFTLSSGDASGAPRVAALGNRIAFAVVTCGGGCVTGAVKAKVWISGTLGADHIATTFSSAGTLKRSYTVDVALAGTANLGLAWNACRKADCTGTDSPAMGQDMIWCDSKDNGATWKSPFTLQSSTGTNAAGKQRRMSAYPSALFLSATKRVVVFDAFNAAFTKGSVLLRTGNGTP